MEVPDILLVAGVLVLMLALRTIHHPVAYKLAGVALLAASFLVGYFATGRVWVGVACVALWFFLPWVELLTRVRRITLPTAADFITQPAPSQQAFPDLRELTEEFENAGFEIVEDAGWGNDSHRLFYRFFYNREKRAEAAVCLFQQGEISIPYLSITTRYASGLSRTSLTFPFSQSLKNHPLQITKHYPHDTSPTALIDAHFAHIEAISSDPDEEDAIVSLDPESLTDLIRDDIKRQLEHNLGIGLLERTESGQIHYSMRGLFFLWLQYLRDLVRL